MIKTLLVAVVVFLIATFPATWLLMLFLGNAGPNVSYWGASARHPGVGVDRQRQRHQLLTLPTTIT